MSGRSWVQALAEGGQGCRICVPSTALSGRHNRFPMNISWWRINHSSEGPRLSKASPCRLLTQEWLWKAFLSTQSLMLNSLILILSPFFSFFPHFYTFYPSMSTIALFLPPHCAQGKSLDLGFKQIWLWVLSSYAILSKLYNFYVSVSFW